MAATVLAQGPAVLEDIEEHFTGALLTLYFLIAAAFLRRAVAHLLTQYRAKQPQSGRVTGGEAQTLNSPSALPALVRLRQARAALPPVTSAPVDSTRTGELRERSDG